MPRSGDTQNSDSWNYVGTSSEDHFEIPGSVGKDEVYEVTVVPRNQGGARRSPKYGSSASVHTKGKTTQPLGPLSGQGYVIGDRVRIQWDCPGNDDLGYYEIREGNWWGGRTIAKTTDTYVEFPVHAPFSNKTYYIKARDRSKNWSDEPIAITLINSPSSTSFVAQANRNYHLDWTGRAEGSVNITYTGDVISLTGVGTGVYTGIWLEGGSTDKLQYFMVEAETTVSPIDATLDLMGMKLTSPYSKRRTLEELTTGSLEGSENRDLYDLDKHDYKLDSLYASLENVKGPVELDDLVDVKVEWRGSTDTGANGISDWFSVTASNFASYQSIQPRITMISRNANVNVECSNLRARIVENPWTDPVVDPTSNPGDIIVRGADLLEALPIGPDNSILYSNGSTLKWGQKFESDQYEAGLTILGQTLSLSGATEITAGAMSATAYRQTTSLTGMMRSITDGTGIVNSFDNIYIEQSTGANYTEGNYLLEINTSGGSTLCTLDPNGAFYAAGDIVGDGILSVGGIIIGAGTVDGVDVSALNASFTGHTGDTNPHNITLQDAWENSPGTFAAPTDGWVLTFPGSSRYETLSFSGNTQNLEIGFESREPYLTTDAKTTFNGEVIIGETAVITGAGDIDFASSALGSIGTLSSSGARLERLLDFYSTTPAAGIVVGEAWMGNYPAAGVAAWGYAPLAENSYTDVSIVQANNGATVLNCSAIGNSINYTVGGGSLVGGTDIARMSTEGLQTYAGIAATFSGDTTFTAGYDMNISANIVGDDIISGNHIRSFPQYIAGSRRSGTWTVGQRIRFNFSSTDNMARQTLNSGEVLKITRIEGNWKNGATAGTWDWELGLCTFQSRTTNTVDTYYLVTANEGDNTDENYSTCQTGSYDSPLITITGDTGATTWMPVLGNAGPGTSASENCCISLFGYVEKP